MFQPGSSLAAARATQGALRRIVEWAQASLSTAPIGDATARLAVREVACTDPACATPEGVEVLMTITAEEWSLTRKVLKAATACEKPEIEATIAELSRSSSSRAFAAQARQRIESSGPIPIAAELFAGQVLARLGEQFKTPADRLAALRVLEAAAAIAAAAAAETPALLVASNSSAVLQTVASFVAGEGGEGAPSDSANESITSPLSDGAAGEAKGAILSSPIVETDVESPEGHAQGATEVSNTEAHASPEGAPTAIASGPNEAVAVAAVAAVEPRPAAPAAAAAPKEPTAPKGPQRRRTAPMPDAGRAGSRLLADDGDEAAAMNRHARGMGGGGIKCPCCNPDDPEFAVDKFLMM